jgi:hypothetical protein
MIDIGASTDFFATWAQGINDLGTIVGAGEANGGILDALRFDGGSVVTLDQEVDNLDGWHLQQAVAVNKRGEIIGSMVKADEGHGCLLVPAGAP